MSKKSLRKFGSGKDIGISLLWYWISYVVVTWIGIAHTIFNILVLHMGSMAQGPGLGEGYEMTKPWHPLYNIILFTVFNLLYLRKVEGLTIIGSFGCSLSKLSLNSYNINNWHIVNITCECCLQVKTILQEEVDIE